MLNTLRGVTRLPHELIDAMQATTETARRLAGLQRAVTDRLASLDRGVRDMLALVSAIAADLERARATVEPRHERVASIEQAVARLDRSVSELQRTLAVVKGDVEDATERLPTPRPVVRSRARPRNCHRTRVMEPPRELTLVAVTRREGAYE